ncbi:MAG TPA: tripartite tricarboxylate transporter substrate-binding protein [Burkholderiales bacterium]|nr:tripartite tricarboxylate transporter substrate-binding protein [Burkholderiales bacterium]
MKFHLMHDPARRGADGSGDTCLARGQAGKPHTKSVRLAACLRLLRCALALWAATAGLAQAQGYPARPLRLVVGYAAGGVGDITARVVADDLAKRLGQPVVVDNRPGAGGIVAAQAVARAEADGYTLLLLNQGNAISASLFKSLPYDILRDFEPVSEIGAFNVVLFVNQGSPLKSVADLVALSRAHPEKVNIGTGPVGNGENMAGLLLKSMLHLEVAVAPFGTASSQFAAIKTGDIQAAFGFVAPVLPHLKAGTLEALAVTDSTRYPGLPSVPTVEEAGIAGYSVAAWNGIAVPAKTPKAVVERLGRELNNMIGAPEISQRFQAIGIEPRGGSPEQFSRLVSSEVAKWRQVIRDSKIEQQ